MLTLNELQAAIVMMKRAPLKGEESLIVAQTIMKLEAMARSAMAPKPEKEHSDDASPAEQDT